MPARKGNKNYKKRKVSGRKTLYKSEYAIQAHKLSLLGATDKEIADFFGVKEQTINNWKKAHVDFFESIRAGKIKADSEVATKLLDRATGSTYTTQKAFKVRQSVGDKGGYIEKIEVVNVTETVPPDTLAIKLWLTNRQPEKWRDKQQSDVNINSNQFDDLMKKVAERNKKDE